MIVGDEVFDPQEIGTRLVRRCVRCQLPYGAGDYGQHADRHHNSGRTPYWRQRDRERRRGRRR